MSVTASWVDNQRELLLLERDVEKQQLSEKLSNLSPQECQEIGLSLLSLDIENSWTSLYGRVKYSIRRRDGKELPIHSFKVGDEAELYQNRKKSSTSENMTLTGIISKVSPTSLELVCEDNNEIDMPGPLRLDLRSSEATHVKMMHTLNDLASNIIDTPAWPLVDVLFGHVVPGQEPPCAISPFNPRLNDPQIAAVEAALSAPHLALIHGPPGTGKTTTVVELIQQAISRDMKLLVCAPSNVAIDNILERLVAGSSPAGQGAPRPPRIIRIGHPARISAAVQQHCLDALISAHEGTEIVHDVRKEIDDARKLLVKARGKKDKARQRELQGDIRTLRREVRKREDKVLLNILSTRNVVMCTCVGAASKLLKGSEYDMVIIDEAAQALEAACWVPMLHSKKVVLAGDHCQLPPTIKSTQAEEAGLGVTLFERIMNDPALSHCSYLLNIQYRMNRDISNWASHEMYLDLLEPHASNACHKLVDILPSADAGSEDLSELADTVMMLIDTSGEDMTEDCCRGGSYRNTAEAEVVVAHVYRLYELGLKPDQIGVITPYNGQLEVLRELVARREEEKGLAETGMTAKETVAKSKLEIRTVDGFQGGEKEAIILSLVRSNGDRKVGFLAERRRINVAVTRAKRHLAVVCDADTCSSDAFIGRLLSHVSESGEHRSAREYLSAIRRTHGEVEEVVTASATDLEEARAAIKDAVKATALGVRGSIVTDVKSSQSVSAARSRADTQSNCSEAPPTAGIPLPPPPAANKKSSASYPGKGKRDPSVASNAEALKRKESDKLAGHLARIVYYFASGVLGGGIIGNGAMRLLLMKSISTTDSSTEGINEEEIIFYSSIITPQASLLSTTPGVQKTLIFPATLTSYQRMTVHSACEGLNKKITDNNTQSDGQGSNEAVGLLSHVSSGPEEARVIAISLLDAEYISPSVTTEPSRLDEGPLMVSKTSYESAFAHDIVGSENEQEELDEEGESSGASKDSRSVASTVTRKSIKKGKKVSAPSSVPSSTAARANDKILNACKSADMDEMDILEQAIKSNQQHAEYRKYRVDGSPMPNPDKKRAAESLRNSIAKAQSARAGEVGNSRVSNGAHSRKKVVKKPPRNFGGGVVGGGS